MKTRALGMTQLLNDLAELVFTATASWALRPGLGQQTHSLRS
jgi:hypothetical protein